MWYYKNFEFPSQEVAEWAVFFDELNIPWSFVQKGQENLWMPEFYLPWTPTPWKDLSGVLRQQGCFVAVRPNFTEKDIDKAMRFSRWPKLDPVCRPLLCVGDIKQLALGSPASCAMLESEETLGFRYSLSFISNKTEPAFFYEHEGGHIFIDKIDWKEYDRVNAAVNEAAKYFEAR